jgi:hypothetical protein
MSPERRETLRRTMTHAWALYRTSREDGRPRTWPACLKASWDRERRASAMQQMLREGGTIAFSHILISSPIARTSASKAADFNAAYLTAKAGE